MENNPLLAKQEFVTMIQWINTRWNNNTWSNNANVKRYYDDFKNFAPDTVWEALNDLYDKGLKFAPTPSEVKRQCVVVSQAHAGEYERRERQDIKGELTEGAKSGNRIGLQRYLDGMGYESFWHAVYETGHKRYKSKQQTPAEGDYYKQPWEEAREWFLEGKKDWGILDSLVGKE
tara:strand:- start:194 stop:718 length:525 start_codon:yes stop_codon:yes gene_type:complete